MRADRLDLLASFKRMYEQRRLEPWLFDRGAGFLQTVLSTDERMPLQFFVDYNNTWWFPILTSVTVAAVSYDETTDSGSIVLAIRYGDSHSDVLHAMQYIEFGEDTITYLRTYASSSFFEQAGNPRISLDRFGNAIWLATGYDLINSARVARLFLESPRGVAFADDPATADVVARIRENVESLLRAVR